jgi:DnaJ-class molecular chaperone
MRGYEIPESFRETCSCCEGAGQHRVCSIMPQKCETCDGSGVVLNQLGCDAMKLLGVRETVA